MWREHRRGGRSPRYFPTSFWMNWIRSWSGGGIASAAMPVTAKSTRSQREPVGGGWVRYFGLAQVKAVCEELDQWIRRKLRCILWRQWKRPRTRARKMMRLGLEEERAWRSAYNGRGPGWKAGASHLNAGVATPS